MTMDYQERSEFSRLKDADVKQGKRIAELLAENEVLREEIENLRYHIQYMNEVK